MGRLVKRSLLAIAGLAACAWAPPAKERPDAGLAEGPLPITRPPHTVSRYGPSRVNVVRVWKEGEAKHQWIHEWEQANFGNKPILRLHVGKTPYSLLVVDGRIAPLVATDTGVWRLEGLEKTIGFARDIEIKGTTVELVAPGGDMASFWTIDFAPKLAIQYWERYDGP